MTAVKTCIHRHFKGIPYLSFPQLRRQTSSSHVFRTCLLSNENAQSGWVSLNSLYSKPSSAACSEDGQPEVSAQSHGNIGAIKTPSQLLFVARRGLRCQVFDTKLWLDIYQRTVDLRDMFIPRQWVEMVHIFKRIKVRQPGLLDMATKELLYHLERLSLEDLSKLALSFAYHYYCQNAMFSRIATVVTTRIQRQNMHSVPNQVSESTEEPPPRHPLSRITSYTHLLGAFAKCNIPHKELFEAVATELLTLIHSREMLIPAAFLVKIFASYASFGYRHHKLFDALCKEMVTAKLSETELLQLQGMMKTLEYQNDLMLNVFAYRLGNADVAKTLPRALASQ